VAADFPSELPERAGTVVAGETRYAYASMPVIWSGGEVAELTIAQSMEEVTGNLRTLRFVLIAAILIAMIPIVASSAVLGRLVTRPIADLTRTMTHIQKSGQYEKLSMENAANDEIGQMGRTFNEMMALLEENYRKQEEFVSNASHELKTPLTVIGSYAKLLERRGMQDEKIAQEGLSAISAETERMNKLIEQLLHIARRSETQLELSEVNLERILQGTVEVMKTSFNRDFVLISEEPGLLVTTDLAKLKQLLYILMDNARKYSSDRIEVKLRMEGAPTIKIQDYGIGIPKEALPYVFDRFYRVDKARSRESGGFGLGLSLAKQLADSIGVVLGIESIEGIGTTVSITFSSDFNVRGIQWNQEGS
jgi:signal transduction histidine kinase